ncbi:MAG: cation:proton antiporter [Candidatus Aenigmarchaeota archaeon]|nr:cation:proton antiporter [Candidatus Aenigmarchaeota archaeon]
MVEPSSVFAVISGIIIFGFLAEFLFRKYHIPDILLLVIMGFVLGPYVLKIVLPEQVVSFAPFFTTFALLFLIFDGAFNINLVSFANGLTRSLSLSLFNYIISFAAITGILLAFGFDIQTASLLGLILGGISSAFVIPVIKQVKITKDTYSILLFESAFTDVFSIVFSIAAMTIISLKIFDLKEIASTIASLFAVAGFIGIIAGIAWIIIVTRILKQHKSYMLTIAYLLIVYTITEFLGGNGAIAALFLGLMLKNSRQLAELFAGIRKQEAADGNNKEKKIFISVTSPEEEFFYSQISFFLKTFFFAYIGILFNPTDINSLLIGAAIAFSLLVARNASSLLTKSLPAFDRRMVNSIFARGLAAAVVAQLAIQYNIPQADMILRIVYTAIIFSIILSSARIFMVMNKEKGVAS